MQYNLILHRYMLYHTLYYPTGTFYALAGLKSKKVIRYLFGLWPASMLNCKIYIKSAYFPLSPTTEYEHIGGPIHI